MSGVNYPLAAVQTLETWEAIRKRPQIYVDLKDPAGIIEEACCQSRADAANGLCSTLTVSLLDGDFVQVQDDGPGWPVDIEPKTGMRKAEVLLRHLFACREAKSPEHRGFCNNGVVVLVALSSDFFFQTVRDGKYWHQRFKEGAPMTPFEEGPPGSAELGTRMTFRLDPTIVPSPRLGVDMIGDRLNAMAEIPNRWVHDLRSSQ
jgi:DNA gyrase subunit B